MTKYTDLVSRLIGHSISFLIIGLLILFSLLCPFRPLFVLILFVLSLFALHEYAELVKKKGFKTAKFLSSLFSFFYLFAILFKWPVWPILGAYFFALFIYFATKKEAIIGLATSLFGIIYIIIPLGLLVLIGTQYPAPANAFWVAFLIIVTKSADMGGYFIGRSFGRHKLAKKLSPNKTIEGALGTIIFAVIAALLLFVIETSYLKIITNFSYLLAFVLGAILAIFAMMGDLAESLLKRDAGVKDSNTIPGIGGILDILDALLFTTPILYFFLKFHYPKIL